MESLQGPEWKQRELQEGVLLYGQFTEVWEAQVDTKKPRTSVSFPEPRNRRQARLPSRPGPRGRGQPSTAAGLTGAAAASEERRGPGRHRSSTRRAPARAADGASQPGSPAPSATGRAGPELRPSFGAGGPRGGGARRGGGGSAGARAAGAPAPGAGGGPARPAPRAPRDVALRLPPAPRDPPATPEESCAARPPAYRSPPRLGPRLPGLGAGSGAPSVAAASVQGARASPAPASARGALGAEASGRPPRLGMRRCSLGRRCCEPGGRVLKTFHIRPH
ncbi:translation initiation factor IF-2-like [Canis lupus dingo]|uniref:translation initiation factor IF-2-like n=1 Tax=Canis lupus dingo TaxID=286419 RepID=UPI0020C4C117|nr:translation initiation factor IF-2-like [Canis lupus dingo]